MKTIISLIALAIFIIGCSTEEKLYTVKKKIRNSSEYPFELTLIDYSNATVFHQVLQPQSSTKEFSQTTNINYIMGWGDVASKIEIRFLNNNRGYECNVEHTGDKCLKTKGSPFKSNNP